MKLRNQIRARGITLRILIPDGAIGGARSERACRGRTVIGFLIGK